MQRTSLDIGIFGTRGIPASYGGFETFAEQLATRLVGRGHRVTVYGRSRFVHPHLASYRGVRIEVLPAVRHKYLETVSHTALSLVRGLFARHDVALICNAANAFLAWIPQLAGQKVTLNVDGIERRRRKWNLLGRAFYRMSEFLATEIPDAAVSDARCIQDYYREEFGATTRFIAYGSMEGPVGSRAALDRLGLSPRGYLLYVSRLEPENNAHLVIEAYLASGVRTPLVVVGDAPYSRRYIDELRRLATRGNVLLPGAIYGTGYRELLSHCFCFVQATEVGGTHPALVEAMGCGCLVLANDTPENREVVADSALLYPFNDREALARLMRRVADRPEEGEFWRKKAALRARRAYDWEQVVSEYETLFYELAGTLGG